LLGHSVYTNHECWPNLTHAGIGSYAFALTCRLDADTPHYH